ncbi:MAG: iron-sulfur cluster assembly scaffold protein [Kangiellaceae bacterium]|nr:iron-sulfur cluster assembly scaffold protein [Kangiellaceae bacterium]
MEKLYQKAIKTHYSSPIGRDGSIDATHFSEGYNASCGDEIDFSLQLNPKTGNIDKITFHDESCAICTASASILCALSVDSSQDHVNQLYQELLLILRPKLEAKENPNNDSPITNLQISLQILSPVSAHPSRINCALLPWQTVLAAFNKPVAATSTTSVKADINSAGNNA